MSVAAFRISEWQSKGLKYQVVVSPNTTPFLIGAKRNIQLPYPQPVDFSAKEGVMTYFGALFDHPLCGIRIAMNPGTDTREMNTVQNFLLYGKVNQWSLYQGGYVPPLTAPGTFGVETNAWLWTDWCRLYIINTDTVPHYCLAYGYFLALLPKTVK